MHLARFCIFFSGTYYVSRWLLIAKWITICFDNHLLPGESDTTVVVWFGNWIAKLGFLTEEENTQKKKLISACPALDVPVQPGAKRTLLLRVNYATPKDVVYSSHHRARSKTGPETFLRHVASARSAPSRQMRMIPSPRHQKPRKKKRKRASPIESAGASTCRQSLLR
jgi:hypothetical protein